MMMLNPTARTARAARKKTAKMEKPVVRNKKKAKLMKRTNHQPLRKQKRLARKKRAIKVTRKAVRKTRRSLVKKKTSPLKSDQES